MALTLEDTEFLEQMVRQLEGTIHRLSETEARLGVALGEDRVSHLRDLWDQRLDREEQLDLRRSLDWTDRELLWMWARLQRARSARAEAGKAIMRHFDGAAAEPP